MSQIIINTGNIANDGTGDPLRTAFNDVNNNFTQVFNAGPVGSNIAIANNTIQTTNTNGNLILATNGVGVVVPAANFVPDRPNTRSIGTSVDRFSTVYAQYINANTGTYSGNVYAGNMHVTGNVVTVNYSTANIGNLNLTLAANASNAALANGAGIIVANANANLIYNYSSNSWDSSIAITAPTFIGDGANLTNVVANVNAINLLGNTLSSSVVYSNLTSFGSVTGLSAIGDISTTGNVYANAIVGNTIFGMFNGDGSNITNITANAIVGNVPFALNANSAYTANLAALATQAINADTALFAINANLAAFSNVATSAQTANSSHYAIQSDNANSAVVAGMAYELSPAANLSVTGNITTGAYFIGDGSQLTNLPAGNYSNANVAAYLPTYTGNVNNLSFSSPNIILGPNDGSGSSYLELNPSDTRIGADAGDITLWASGQIWSFDGTGNITLPTNTSSINYANGQPYGGGGNFTGNVNAVNVTATGNVSAGNLYIGNTLFTRTLLVGTWTAPVTVPLASNNSFNVLTANGSSNIVVYTT